MKRILSVLLVSVLLVGVLIVAPISASAASYVTVAKEKTYRVEGRSFTYRIPKINLNSTDATAANREISNKFAQYFEKVPSELVAASNDTGVNYYTYLNGAILSVVIYNHAPYNQYIAYDIYNFNVNTGKRLYNSDILAIKNASISGVHNNLTALLRREFKSVINSENEQLRKTAEACQRQSVYESNLNDSFYFLGKNGKLMAVYAIYWVAGSGRYYRLAELNAYASTPKIAKFTNVNSGVNMTWNKSAGAAKYRVFAKTSAGWKKAADVASNSYTYKTAASGKKYTFTVRAMDKNGNFISSYNNTGFSYTFLSAPKISTLTNTSSGIVVRWNRVTGAKKYRLFVKTTGGWKQVGDTTGTSWKNTKVKNGTRYTYTVRCVTSSGKSYVSGYNKTGTSIICKR